MRLPLLSTDAEVDLFDHNGLGDSCMPVKRFEAIHKRLGVMKIDGYSTSLELPLLMHNHGASLALLRAARDCLHVTQGTGMKRERERERETFRGQK